MYVILSRINPISKHLKRYTHVSTLIMLGVSCPGAGEGLRKYGETSVRQESGVREPSTTIQKKRISEQKTSYCTLTLVHHTSKSHARRK